MKKCKKCNGPIGNPSWKVCNKCTKGYVHVVDLPKKGTPKTVVTATKYEAMLGQIRHLLLENQQLKKELDIMLNKEEDLVQLMKETSY